MIWITGHPGHRRLNQFADGELRRPERARVARHLVSCPRCRRDVAFFYHAAGLARSFQNPRAPMDILRQAIRRRGSGERVLLPAGDVGAPAPRPRRALPATVAVLLAVTAAALLSASSPAEADRSGLHIAPERPRAGATLAVEYRDARRFADVDHLELRARYRSGGHATWPLLAGILTRDADGVFRATVTLPDSVVHAAFTVEGPEGVPLDSRDRRLLDVLVRDDRTGALTLAAIGARVEDLVVRD